MQAALSLILSTYDSGKPDFKKLCVTLRNNTDLVKSEIANIDHALVGLDPEKHTIGFCYFLYLKTCSEGIDVNVFLNQASRLILSCNATQIRIIPDWFKAVCESYVMFIMPTNPLRGIKHMKVAINRVAPTSRHMTPQHWMYILLCIISKCYKAALRVLNEDHFDLNPEHTAVDYRDVLLYHYYGSIALIGNNQYKRAHEFLKVVVTMPGYSVSAIMVEGWKKYILVSLILDGNYDTTGKDVSSKLQNYSKMIASYEEFAKAISLNNMSLVNYIIADNLESFQKDHNLGLVKQCIKSLQRMNIANLTKTYITLSLEDIATTAELENKEEIEDQLIQCIELGLVSAKISHQDGMVSFQNRTSGFDKRKDIDYIESQMRETIDFHNTLVSVDRQISLSIDYLEKIYMVDRSLLKKLASAPGYPKDRFPFEDAPLNKKRAKFGLKSDD